MTENTLHDLFAKQAAKSPEKTALQFGNDTLSYRELDQKSNQLANYLIKKGVKTEDFISIFIDRSFEMIIGILGILKAGAAYVPIDTEYPQERINYILNDTKCDFVITNSKNYKYLSELVNGATLINLEEDVAEMQTTSVAIEVKPANLAYILYTSGSTGTPKGVMLEHRNVVRLFIDTSPLVNFNSDDVWALFHSYCFDVSVWEMFSCLLFGGKLVIVPKDIAKNASAFGKLIEDCKVTMLHQTPSAFNILQENILVNSPQLNLKYIIFCGEALDPSKLKNWANKYPDCKLVNTYGITEVGVYNTFQEITTKNITSAKSIIGVALPTDYMYLLDENKNEVNIGVEGELYIGGSGLARGYLNLPELSSARFTNDPLSNDPTARLYRSGDLAILQEDGTFEYIGRIDDQVKVNGFRVEMGEIASHINKYEGVTQSIVLAKDNGLGEKKLIAYYQSTSPINVQQLIKSLQSVLPAYMVPRIFIPITKIPLNTNGKADKKALFKLKIERPALDTIYKKPVSVTEKNIYNIWSDFLEIDEIGVDDNFFELGGTSLVAQRTVVVLKNTYQYQLPITKVYQLPTIAGLANYLDKNQNRQKEEKQEKLLNVDNDIAVIGMSGRFPGADTIEEFWNNLENGKESITFFDDETIDPSIPDLLKNDPAYVKARGIIKEAEMFDASFFGINTKLAELMDPQQRIFLEIAWETLEKTGHLPNNYKQKVGVFAGFGTNTYYENNVLSHLDKVENQGKIQVLSVNEKDYASSRTAYHLNLKGPAVSVHSACSTSLLAITQAVNSLRANQCDVALAGAASVTSPINSGHLYQEGSMLSADGHCKPFDDSSTGTTFSDGAGVVLLKRLADAKQDGDVIYAVIKGVGINNDGYGKGSFTAPSSEGQADAIVSAINDAGINATEISYVEAHGTGTPIGDPIEFEGLVDAFGIQDKNQYCAMGSVKSNIGHLTQAAGVAGFIKTCLALHYKKIPASIGHNVPNKNIDFANSPFYVNTQLKDWNDEKSRFAGVSSFGVGGTNVHVVLESYDNDALPTSKNSPFELIRLSAQSENSLTQYQNVLANHLKQNSQNGLGNIAYTLHAKRKPFKHRAFVVSNSETQLADILTKPESAELNTNVLTEVPVEMVFSFPGQGAQYINMGLALYQNEPIYKAAVDSCALILQDLLNEDIRTIIFADANSTTASTKLKNTKYTQPALFVTEYALATLWMSWGIEPSLLIGHSVGEYVAAHIAGILSLQDALTLVANRGLLISELPAGSMLSVRAKPSDIQPLLAEDLSIAAINSHLLCVVAGPTDQIASLAKLLDQKEIANKPLFTSHAFHSSMMDPILGDFKSIVEKVQLSKPNIKIISTVTGELLTDEQAVDVNYWTNHLRQTVQFQKAVETMLNYSSSIVLEIGPGAVTSTLVKQIAAFNKINIKTVATLDQNKNAFDSMQNAIGQLWINGIDINLDAYYTDQHIVELPAYQFDRQKYWVSIDRKNITTNNSEIPASPISTELLKDETNIRKENLTKEVKRLLEHASGIDMMNVNTNQNFLEIGFDSLLLTQVATSLKRKFNLPITFRRLNEEYPNLAKLVAYLDANLPAEEFMPINKIQLNTDVVSSPVHTTTQNILQPIGSIDNTALGLIAQQLNILTQQLVLLQSQNQVQIPIANQLQNIPKILDSEIVVDNKNLSYREDITSPIKLSETNQINNNFGLTTIVVDANTPPVKGAKLGKDRNGNPAWFIQDPDNDSKYLQISTN